MYSIIVWLEAAGPKRWSLHVDSASHERHWQLRRLLRHVLVEILAFGNISQGVSAFVWLEMATCKTRTRSDSGARTFPRSLHFWHSFSSMPALSAFKSRKARPLLSDEWSGVVDGDSVSLANVVKQKRVRAPGASLTARVLVPREEPGDLLGGADARSANACNLYPC